MIKIVSFKICPFVQRVTALLEAKKIAYDIEYISLQDKPSWFLDISPNGQVPLLITDNGQALFESDAIVEYIDDISAPLESALAAEQKAKDRAWSYQAAKHYLLQCSTMRSKDKASFCDNYQKLQQVFAKAEAVIEGPLFKGEQLSNPDIAWLPLLHRSDIILAKTGCDLAAGLPKVQQWRRAVVDSGLVSASVSADFETIFSQFYLAETTFLGQVMRAKANNDCDPDCCGPDCCNNGCCKETCCSEDCCEDCDSNNCCSSQPASQKTACC